MERKQNIEKWIKSEFSEELLLKLKEENPDDTTLLKAELIVNSTKKLQPNYKLSKEDLWNKIEDKTNSNIVSIDTPKTKPVLRWWVAAASVILIIRPLS